jgi:hypothetical protein
MACMTLRACENCAVEDDELLLVRRVYITPEGWDRPGSLEVVPDPELWCVSCVTQYPCEPVEEDTAEEG